MNVYELRMVVCYSELGKSGVEIKEKVLFTFPAEEVAKFAEVARAVHAIVKDEREQTRLDCA